MIKNTTLDRTIAPNKINYETESRAKSLLASKSREFFGLAVKKNMPQYIVTIDDIKERVSISLRPLLSKGLF